MAAGAGASRGYMPQLDTLRAFAVAGVVVSHWLPGNPVSRVLPLGMMGVTLFFVLSGFLISKLLLADAGAPGAATGPVLWRFYARRTLRIFPAYYLVLALGWLAYPGEFREQFGWYLGYASNVLFWRAQAWVGPMPHLWTLAVEEQFYLLWPLLLLSTPRRWLPRVMLAAVLLGPLARALLFQASDGSPRAADFAHVLMPTCLDCFGLGAWLACRRHGQDAPAPLRSAAWLAFVLANAASLWWFKDSWSAASVLLFRFNVAVLSLALIDRASLGIGGPAGALLENRVGVYLGRISYGLYLYHVPVLDLYAWLGLPSSGVRALDFFAWLALLLLVATASWFCLERPLNRIGNRFRPREAAVYPRASPASVVK